MPGTQFRLDGAGLLIVFVDDNFIRHAFCSSKQSNDRASCGASKGFLRPSTVGSLHGRPAVRKESWLSVREATLQSPQKGYSEQWCCAGVSQGRETDGSACEGVSPKRGVAKSGG